MLLLPFAISFLSTFLALASLTPGPALSQDVRQVTTTSDWAWRPVIDQDGVEVEYIFYAEKESVDDGVVIKLVNNNDHDVAYRFTVIIKSPNSSFEREVEGVVKAKSLVTGDDAGLYWVPFRNGESIGELGLRGLKLERIN